VGMRGFLRAFGQGILALVFIAAALDPCLARPVLSQVALEVAPSSGVRVILYLSESPRYHIFTLSRPDRVVIDLAETDLRLKTGQRLPAQRLVQAMRFGVFQPGTSRMVLDVTQPVVVAGSRLIPAQSGLPPRLIFELEAASAGSSQATVSAPSQPGPAPAGGE